MTHAAEPPKVSTFGLIDQTPPKEPRLNDTEITHLATVLRLNPAQNMSLIRFIERLD